MYQITITHNGPIPDDPARTNVRQVLAVEVEEIDLEAIVKAIFGLKRTRGPSKAVAKKAK